MVSSSQDDGPSHTQSSPLHLSTSPFTHPPQPSSSPSPIAPHSPAPIFAAHSPHPSSPSPSPAGTSPAPPTYFAVAGPPPRGPGDVSQLRLCAAALDRTRVGKGRLLVCGSALGGRWRGVLVPELARGCREGFGDRDEVLWMGLAGPVYSCRRRRRYSPDPDPCPDDEVPELQMLGWEALHVVPGCRHDV